MNNWTLLLTCTYPMELVVTRARLESEGIECMVKDEISIQVNPFYSNALGGIKLFVKIADHEKAISIIHDIQNMEIDENEDLE